MSPHLQRLLTALRHPDAVESHEIFPPGRRAVILAAIVATEGAAVPSMRLPRRWRLRMRIALPVAGLAAAAVTLALIIALQSPQAVHAAGVSFRHPKSGPNSGYIIATVTNPFAAQASLDAAFQQAGLDLTVMLVPASPSAVGTVVFIDESAGAPQIEPLTGGACVTGGGGPGHCPVGVKIPRDFTGSGYITLGRPAKPGEQYESSNDAFAPGEMLHCSGLLGKTVAVAAAELAKRGISIQWREDGSSKQPSPDEYVVDGIPNTASSVFLFVQTTPPSSALLARDAQMYDTGCS
jgi:hypothetical protein